MEKTEIPKTKEQPTGGYECKPTILWTAEIVKLF